MKVFKLCIILVAYLLIGILEVYSYYLFKNNGIGIFTFFTLIGFIVTFGIEILNKYAYFKELRESSNLSVQKTCFCCGHKFQPEDFISLACFDKGMGNKFLCQKCKGIALKDLGDKNIYLH